MVARAFERDSLFSLIAGPMVWTVHFLTIYVFTALACARGFFDLEALGVPIVPLVGGAVTVVAVALIVDAGVLSWRRWQGGQRGGSRRMTTTIRPAGGASWPMPVCCCPASP